MAARATWKGLLKISLVTLPIKVYPATSDSETVKFHQLHADCKSRVSQKRWCASCDRELASDEIVKGYEFKPGQYVELLDEELDAVKPESTRVIDVTQWADASELDPVSIGRSYYLAPDGLSAGEAFAVMSTAMDGKVGLGKWAISGREYLVAVRAHRTDPLRRPVVLLHTLHHAAEIRSSDELDDLPTFTRVPSDQVRLARAVITACLGPLNLADFTDEYQGGLRQVIDAKIAGNDIVVPSPVGTPAAALLFQDALLASVSAAKKTPAKALSSGTRKRA